MIAGAGAANATGMMYHNGSVMLGTTHIGCAGGSPYYNINITYYDGMGRHVANSVTYGGGVFDSSVGVASAGMGR